MQLITLERKQTTKLFWLLLGFIGVAVATTAKQTDPVLVAVAALLVLAALAPFYFWLLGWSNGLPIWPVYALVTGVTAALPILQDPVNLDEYTGAEITGGAMGTAGFIILGSLVWLGMTSKAPKAPRSLFMVEHAHAVRYLLLFVGLGLLFGLIQFTGLIQFPGNTMPVVRGITGSLSTMGLFVLGFYQGRGMLDKASKVLFALGIAGTVLMGLTSLMLAPAIVPTAMVVFGYMLGSDRLPLRAIAVIFVFAALLHAGKHEMRSEYWGGEATKTLTWDSLPSFYSGWLSHGLYQTGGLSGVLDGVKEDSTSTSIFERTGNLHMLLTVMKKSPEEVPYLGGMTYAHIPRLLVPRFIDSEKGSSHTGNVLLSVNYGLLTLEQVGSTSIGWGLLSEAYANFGYLGLAALAVVLAIYYSIMTRLTVGVPMTSLRFVLGLMALAAATSADTMGIFVSSQFQAMIGVSLAAMVLMRRQPNPFAAEGGGEGMRQKGNGIREKANGIRHTANGIRQEAEGVPAPGVLVGLIEGAQPEGGGGHTADGMRQTAYGGTVRTMPIRMPKRIASWMPRRVRQQVAEAARSAVEEGAAEGVAVGQKDGPSGSESLRVGEGQEAGEVQTANGIRQTASERPRQLAVPYRNYRRYRGA